MQGDLDVKVYINSKGKRLVPVLVENMTLSTHYKGVPGELNFSVVKDDRINFTEGNSVELMVNGAKVFHGFVFEKSRDKSEIINVKAYDQLRYLQNKDSLEFTPRTADQYIARIAGQTRLVLGELDDTGYTIPPTAEEGSSYFEMILKALDTTKENTDNEYVLYDDCKKLMLKDIDSDFMKLDFRIDENNLENFTYRTSINKDTYTKIKLIKDDGKKKQSVQEFVKKDDETIAKWGVLTYLEKLSRDEENIYNKASKLLKKHNKKNVVLSLKNVFGDIRVRAGKSVVVNLDLGDMILNQHLFVTRCTHSFSEGMHFMNLEVKGGVIDEQ